MKRAWQVGQTYWNGQDQVKLLQVLPEAAEARKDAQVQDLTVSNGKKFWMESSKLKEQRPETVAECFQRQADEAHRDVEADLALATSGSVDDYWMSQGGKEIATAYEASFSGGIQISKYEWGQFETGVTITVEDARSLRDWLTKFLGE